MPAHLPVPGHEDYELKGISRTVAEIEWLLVILVLFYQVLEGPAAESAGFVYLGVLAFSTFVIGFRYFNLLRTDNRWKIAIETWAMIVFITWVLYHGGGLASPLVNLYILVIVTSALTLGRLVTLLEVALVAACYVLLGFSTDLERFLTVASLGSFVVQTAPLVLVAYVTSMLAADIRHAVEQIRLVSQMDELTGVYNLRAFKAISDRTFRQAARYSRVFSILMVDSDHLKSINDRHGHDAGTRLIKLTVRGIRDTVRETDVVARLGGDEFIVLLPETPAEGALEVAERIRARVERQRLETQGQDLPTTVSIGVASFPLHGADLAAVMSRADSALYASKQAGRNRVTLYREG
jgi:diguanylate cyclase (GGDEF)-like protein